MPHPQERELRKHLQEFFADAPDTLPKSYRTLTVFEPDSGASIEFYYSDLADADDDESVDIMELYEKIQELAAEPEANENRVSPTDAQMHEPDDEGEFSAYVRFGWQPTGERDEEIAERLGVSIPRMSIEKNPFTGHTFEVAGLVRRTVAGVDEALWICLTVLREVIGIPDERWLWITDIEEFDDWPNPLPQPQRWPPENSASEEG